VIIAGRARLQDNPPPPIVEIVDGTNDAGLASVALIVAPAPSVTITQRASAEVSRFKNDNRTGLELDQNDRDAYAYRRLELAHARSPRVSTSSASRPTIWWKTRGGAARRAEGSRSVTPTTHRPTSSRRLRA
jgi:hypothetical protein